MHGSPADGNSLHGRAPAGLRINGLTNGTATGFWCRGAGANRVRFTGRLRMPVHGATGMWPFNKQGRGQRYKPGTLHGVGRVHFFLPTPVNSIGTVSFR